MTLYMYKLISLKLSSTIVKGDIRVLGTRAELSRLRMCWLLSSDRNSTGSRHDLHGDGILACPHSRTR